MIRRLTNAYRAELRKLLHRKLVLVGIPLALLLGVGGTAAWEPASRAAVQIESGRVAPMNGFAFYADALAAGVFVGAVFLVIYAGLFIAEEFELGTAKIVFSKPVRRVEVLAAKALILVTLALALTGLVALAAAGAGGALYGYQDVVKSADFPDSPDNIPRAVMVHHAIVATALVPLPLIATLFLACLVSALSRQSGIAVGLTFGAIIVSLVGTWLVDRASPFLVTSYYSFPTELLKNFAFAFNVESWSRQRWGGSNGPPKVALDVAVSAAYALVAFVAAAVTISRRSILGIALAAAILLGGEARAKDHKIAFREDEIAVPGQVEDVEVVDVDEDGWEDLVVYHTTGAKGPNPQRFLSIFYQRPLSKDFAKTPDQTIVVPPSAVVRFIADVDPRAKGKEIGFMGPRGAFCYLAQNRRFAPVPVPLIQEEGFYDIASGNQLPSWNALAKDMNGDGLADLLFLKKGTAVLFLQKKGGGFGRAGEIPLDYRQTFGPKVESMLLGRFLSFYATLGKPAIEDVNGDKLADIVTLHEKSLDTYIQHAGEKRFAETPDRRMPLRVVSGDAATSDDEFNQIRTTLDDVDGDGFKDLILYRNLGKVSLFESMRTQIIFYRGGPQGWDEAKPAQILNLKGISIDPALIDIDGDGKKDLVVSSLRTDLVTNAMRALFNSVTVTYFVFRYDKETKRFHETPDFSRDVKIDLSRLEGSGSIPYAYFWGDYDGDGTMDLLSLEEEGALHIDPGEASSGFWSGEKLDFPESGRVRIEVETSNSLRIQDLNRDGKADILLWYYPKKAEDPERGQIKLLLSK